MAEHPSLYLLVPVFNEAQNIEALFASFRLAAAEFADAFHLQVVLVDDGSSDGTADIARRLGNGLDLVVLANPVNQGPGSAFGLGFEYLAPRLSPADWVMTLEGDNTSRRELMRQMFRRSEEGYDVILASPYAYGGGITNTSALRVFMSHMANAFVKEMLGAHGILTVSSFFRLYRAPVILKLQSYYGPRIVERSGFESMVELLLKLMYLRATISEVPMVLDTSLRVGKSKLKVWRTVRGYVALSRRLNAWRGAANIAQQEPAPARTPA
jgi:dolichol-phosphate mannosyltransferase